MLSGLGCIKQWDAFGAQGHIVLAGTRSARMGMLWGQAVLAHWRSEGMMLWVLFASWHEKTPLERNETGHIEEAKGSGLLLRVDGELQPK